MLSSLEPWKENNCPFKPLFSIAAVGKANDCALVLRKQLYDYFTSISSNSAFYRKWKWEFLKENKQVLYQLNFLLHCGMCSQQIK